MTEHHTILVASSDLMFVDVVGQMVAEAGFLASPCAPGEPPCLAMTRVLPRLVICDCIASDRAPRRFAVEAIARGLPILLFRAGHGGRRTAPARIRTLTLPVSCVAFVATLDDLLAIPPLGLALPSRDGRSPVAPRIGRVPARRGGPHGEIE